jgi:hypothetical protein
MRMDGLKLRRYVGSMHICLTCIYFEALADYRANALQYLVRPTIKAELLDQGQAFPEPSPFRDCACSLFLPVKRIPTITRLNDRHR